MKFDKLYSIPFLLGILKLAQCVEMTFYGTAAEGNRPSKEQAPACGIESEFLTTDYYVALNQYQFENSKTGSSSYSATVCGRCIKVFYKNRYCVGKIIDSCPGCQKDKGIDVSPELFEKLENLGEGRISGVDWEFLDSCSSLGKYGECSGGKCTASSSSSSSKSKTTKITSSVAKPTTVINTEISNGNSKIYNNGTVVLNNEKEEKNKESPSSSTSTTTSSTSNSTSNETDDDEGSYALPITGAVALTCAAGLGLVYAKRNSNSYEEMKQKFPEAFGNLKRSITRGSSNLRRSLSNSGTNLRRSLSNSGTKLKRRLSGRNQASAVAGIGASVRTKADYRKSLNSHYYPTMEEVAKIYQNNDYLLNQPQPVYKFSKQYDFVDFPATIEMNDERRYYYNK